MARAAALLVCLAALSGTNALTFPKFNTAWVAELTGAKAPNSIGVTAAAKGVAHVIFTYNGNEKFLAEVVLDKAALGLGPTSLNLYYKSPTRFIQLLTLLTSFTGDDILPISYKEIGDVIAEEGFPAVTPLFNETYKLVFVLFTARGALAGRFPEGVSKGYELLASTTSIYRGFVAGGRPFIFGVTPQFELRWPSFATVDDRFRMSITRLANGTNTYKTWITDNLGSATRLGLAYRNGTTNYVVTLALPLNTVLARTTGGYSNTFLTSKLRAGLLARGQKLTTELYPILRFADGSGMSGRFNPQWRFDPNP